MTGEELGALVGVSMNGLDEGWDVSCTVTVGLLVGALDGCGVRG